MTTVLELQNVGAAYDGDMAVRDVSLAVTRGETVVLLGRSGSGKSTVLRVLLGLLAPSHGRVLVGGAVTSENGKVLVPPEERNLSVVFQELALWPHLSVERNVSFALEARYVAKREREALVAKALSDMELGAKAKNLPHELSGGERQRVALARALVGSPVAILLDEPLTSLDPLLKREMRDLLQRTFAARGATALYVTHDLEEARALGARIAVLDEGRIVQAGTWDELCAQPATELVRRLTTL